MVDDYEAWRNKTPAEIVSDVLRCNDALLANTSFEETPARSGEEINDWVTTLSTPPSEETIKWIREVFNNVQY